MPMKAYERGCTDAWRNMNVAVLMEAQRQLDAQRKALPAKKLTKALVC